MRSELKKVATIMIGATILAFGSYNFNYQNSVTEGGVLGLLLLIKNVFDISPSLTSLVIDLSLFALGTKFFGKKFLLYSMLSTFTFSTMYNTFERIGFLVPNLEHNMLLASILAGIGVGIGVGLVVRGGGASGGDDVIALIGNKFTPLKVNHIYLISDGIVLFLSLVYLDFKQIVFSLIAVTISGKIISIIYNDEDQDEDSDKEDEQEETILV
ncbi:MULTISPECIES: YitT family protein [Peptostreptococcaceae]|nr:MULTISPECIES: YitT family protein [Paraclostridium]MCU9808873.1 YitT family protein [Paraclostridium sp. AKS46]MDV8110711.1 YitT family protein [Bacillus sp. BAU-SS-2023]MBZ6006089.1 YitT family protein [Paraclostridium bifermentans]MCR1874787.1 YitT family protein [Paraclostridium bifermentans]MDU0297500.1 YitT family protein [Paraclostridium sp. MRS3W1]